MKRLLLLSLAFALAGCMALRERRLVVTDVDGSSDHRLFRIGAATRLMLEPVLWRLEDRHLMDFDRPVTDYFKDELPGEYRAITLRMLHENASGLPDDFLDSTSFSGIHDIFTSNAFGTDRWRDFNRREAFVAKLREDRCREAVVRRESQPSTVGYALLMMAICDKLNKTLDELVYDYLSEPYGLKDTVFVPEQGMRSRLTMACAGVEPYFLFAGSEVSDHRGEGEARLFSCGMLTSASDLLRVAYVILPHLDRVKGLFQKRKLSDNREISYLQAETYGGRIFIGFDPKDRHVTLILRNDSGFRLNEGFDVMENLVNPPREEEN